MVYGWQIWWVAVKSCFKIIQTSEISRSLQKRGRTKFHKEVEVEMNKRTDEVFDRAKPFWTEFDRDNPGSDANTTPLKEEIAK